MADNLVTREIRRLQAATGYSMRGFIACWKNEASFRFEVLLACIFVPLGFWLGQGAVEKSLMVGSTLLVMLVEIINSAIESVVDRISEEHHELSGRAKDQGSAAVLVSMFIFWVVWGLVLFT